VSLERAVFSNYEGSFAIDRNHPEARIQTARSVLEAKVSIDEEGTLWLDLDTQPRLEIRPYSETEFFIPGFNVRGRFILDPLSGKAKRMIMIFAGVSELTLHRQD